MNNNTVMKLALIPIISMSILLLLPFSGSGADVPTTRQQTIMPIAIAPGTPQIGPSNVPMYAVYGYSAWQWGAGTNEGRKFDLMPAGYTGATNSVQLLSFFSMSDIHITDKESPAQVPYMGWSASFGQPGEGNLNISSYSPVILDTTFHLDAAVRTINALHSQTPFDFGMVLGDNCNASQYNELRWFIDVMDRQYITPSSGAHLGATTIDYQMPFQSAGLDRSIPWYEAVGNHDQMWMGIGCPTTPKIQQALVGSNILNISTNGPLLTPGGSEGTGMYVGVVDGTTPYGDVINWGLTNNFLTPPAVAADTNRHSLTLDISSPTNYINEFFNTVSSPQGHGFSQGITGSLAACYTFEPLTNMPIKVIVLDDTCKSNEQGQIATFYGGGWVDAARYSWLTNELQKGQDAEQLMIIATHIPIYPQDGLFDTNRNNGAQFYPDPANQTETNLIATLHNYPNLLMVMAGHRHVNVVTPFPSPDPAHPEYGFWEVETPSLRDFPRQFRTWDIRRNSDNSISIVTTDVDPQVVSNSPAWKSIGYGVGAIRIYGDTPLTDTTSHTYNAELVKQLTPDMKAKLSGSRQTQTDYDGDGKADPTLYLPAVATLQALQAGDETTPSAGSPLREDATPGQAGQAGIWRVKLSSANYYQINTTLSGLGGPGAASVGADYDGDQKADPAVYYERTGRWVIMLSSANYEAVVVLIQTLGGAGYGGMPADYDGDGLADPGVYQRERGDWKVLMSSANYNPVEVLGLLGGTGYLAVAADYDGDGLADPAVYGEGTGDWKIMLSGSNYSTLNLANFLGGSGYIPFPADYDGDGLADPAVKSTIGNEWIVMFSTGNYAPVPLTLLFE